MAVATLPHPAWSEEPSRAKVGAPLRQWRSQTPFFQTPVVWVPHLQLRFVLRWIAWCLLGDRGLRPVFVVAP